MMHKNKNILDGKGKEVFSIFFQDWLSIKEASNKYDGKEFKNNRTVYIYFNKFKDNGWIDSKYILRESYRKRGNKVHKYMNKCLRFRANLNFFFEYAKKIRFDDFEKEYINRLFESKEIREKLILSLKKDNIKDKVKRYLMYLVDKSLEIEDEERIHTKSMFNFFKNSLEDIQLRLPVILMIKIMRLNAPYTLVKATLDKFKGNIAVLYLKGNNCKDSVRDSKLMKSKIDEEIKIYEKEWEF
ncbi:MAG: hypothetical protein ACP5NZ_01310 [Nanobdellota archaeon]